MRHREEGAGGRKQSLPLVWLVQDRKLPNSWGLTWAATVRSQFRHVLLLILVFPNKWAGLISAVGLLASQTKQD